MAYNFLASGVQWIPWSPTGDPLDATRLVDEIGIKATAVRNGAITVKLPQTRGINLSNGALLIRYHAAHPLAVVMTLTASPKVFQNEIFIRFDITDTEKEIRIPMPATPGLEGVSELVMRFGDDHTPLPVDLTITGFEFVPAR